MDSLQERIQNDMKAAMKSQDARRLGTIRLLRAAIKQREVDERITLDDTQVLAILDKMIKQRHDSAEQYQKANRPDLLEQEVYEISVLQAYLPTQLSEAEVLEHIEKTLVELSASGMKDMGRVMAHLKPQLQGRADMGLVSIKLKEKLGG